jgi:uncharacterized protein YqcC (DUF446 family)
MTEDAKRSKNGDPPKDDMTSRAKELLQRIIAEMRRIGMYDVPMVSADQLQDMGAFGSDTMSFEQWLRWVFVPRVETLVENDGPWPDTSDVGVIAIKNFDGNDKASELVTLLCQFDGLFTEAAKKVRPDDDGNDWPSDEWKDWNTS